MKRWFRDSLSPSMAVALVALVIAMSGTGYAAARFGQASVSSDQVKDQSVRTANLRAGAAAQPVLQPGQKMIGYFAAGGGSNGWMADSITFPAKLPAGFVNNHVRYLEDGDPFTDKCPGPGTAKRGWMCFYEGQSSGATLCCIYNQSYNDPATADYGTRIYWNASDGSSYADGQWVVRAP